MDLFGDLVTVLRVGANQNYGGSGLLDLFFDFRRDNFSRCALERVQGVSTNNVGISILLPLQRKEFLCLVAIMIFIDDEDPRAHSSSSCVRIRFDYVCSWSFTSSSDRGRSDPTLPHEGHCRRRALFWIDSAQAWQSQRPLAEL